MVESDSCCEHHVGRWIRVWELGFGTCKEDEEEEGGGGLLRCCVSDGPKF